MKVHLSKWDHEYVMKLNTSRLILLSVVTVLASICVGVVIAQPSNGLARFNAQALTITTPESKDVMINGTVNPIYISTPYLPANATTSGSAGGSTIVSPPIYPYPYYGDNYLVQMISQLLTTARDGTYTNLSISTQNGVTTIKADEVIASSYSFSLHLTGFKGVIDNNAHTVSVSASLIDYKEGATTFYGKDISFSSPYYTAVYNQGIVTPPTGK
jgi:hypothetical protein